VEKVVTFWTKDGSPIEGETTPTYTFKSEAVSLTFWPEMPPLGLRRPPRCAQCMGVPNYFIQADYAELEMRIMARLAEEAGFEVYR
jgi:hypothetical protein